MFIESFTLSNPLDIKPKMYELYLNIIPNIQLSRKSKIALGKSP